MSEEEWIPENTSQLLESIAREWELLIDVVGRLDETGMTTPDEGGWSPKDNLAHVSEWLNVLMGYHLDRRPRHEVLGVPEEVTRDWDFTIINPVLFERNRNRSTADVLAELHRRYDEVMERLRALPFEYLLTPRHSDDPEKRPVLMWVMSNTTWHFAEHRETIAKMLPRA